MRIDSLAGRTQRHSTEAMDPSTSSTMVSKHDSQKLTHRNDRMDRVVSSLGDLVVDKGRTTAHETTVHLNAE